MVSGDLIALTQLVRVLLLRSLQHRDVRRDESGHRVVFVLSFDRRGSDFQ